MQPLVGGELAALDARPFSEEQLQARAGFSGENLAVIRQWILKMLKQNK
jgi:hypothetical protein